MTIGDRCGCPSTTPERGGGSGRRGTHPNPTEEDKKTRHRGKEPWDSSRWKPADPYAHGQASIHARGNEPEETNGIDHARRRTPLPTQGRRTCATTDATDDTSMPRG